MMTYRKYNIAIDVIGNLSRVAILSKLYKRYKLKKK